MYIIEIERDLSGTVVRLFKDTHDSPPIAQRLYDHADPPGMKLLEQTVYLALGE
jgi:hypothetical protein